MPINLITQTKWTNLQKTQTNATDSKRDLNRPITIKEI